LAPTVDHSNNEIALVTTLLIILVQVALHGARDRRFANTHEIDAPQANYATAPKNFFRRD
jgi:hypothetical protein